MAQPQQDKKNDAPFGGRGWTIALAAVTIAIVTAAYLLGGLLVGVGGGWQVVLTLVLFLASFGALWGVMSQEARQLRKQVTSLQKRWDDHRCTVDDSAASSWSGAANTGSWGGPSSAAAPSDASGSVHYTAGAAPSTPQQPRYAAGADSTGLITDRPYGAAYGRPAAAKRPYKPREVPEDL